MKSESDSKIHVVTHQERNANKAPSLLPSGTTLDLTVTDEQRIRELAYQLYEERGRVNGYDIQDWPEAESIFLR